MHVCVLLLIPQVNIPHLLHYAASFDHDNDALIIGHVIDGVWTRVHGFSGGAGMLISRKALSIFGCALSTGTMPLPPQGESSSSSTQHTAQQAQQSHLPPSTLSLPTLLKGVPNDAHIVNWARRLNIQPVHTNRFWYAALPADARVVHYAGYNHARPSRGISDYVGPNGVEGVRRRAAFSVEVGLSGSLDAQMLGAVVLHRVPPELMRAIDARLDGETRRI